MKTKNGEIVYAELLKFLETEKILFTSEKIEQYKKFYSKHQLWLGCQIYLFLGSAMKDITDYDLRSDDAVHFFKWITHKLPEEEKIFENDAPIIPPT